MGIEKILETGEFKKKGKINSRDKGQRLERDIVKFLNERFKDQGRFARTPGSGAFGSTHLLPDGMFIYEDIIVPKNFNFVIECKSGYDLDFQDVFNENSAIIKWIAKLNENIKKYNKNWLIIYKKDRRNKVIVSNISQPCTNSIELSFNGTKSFFYDFDEFFHLNDSFFFS